MTGWRGAAVLGWSGMRGVVTLAAAQSLPADTPLLSRVASSHEDRAVLDERRELRLKVLASGEGAIRDAATSGEYNAHTLVRARQLLDAEVIRLETTRPHPR